MFDHLDQPLHDCSLPLRATLLYENGLAVKQTSTSEPLLVGETDVVALQGAASVVHTYFSSLSVQVLA